MTESVEYPSSDEDMFMSPNQKRRKKEPTPPPFVPLPEKEGINKKKVEAVRALLIGIPPPPEVTNPDYNLQTILDAWDANKEAFLWTKDPHLKVDETNHGLGMCLNADSSCEELESLFPVLSERYVWTETYCWTGRVYVKLTNSAKKRKRKNGWAASPKTRINYLSRRRNTFRTISPRKTFMVIRQDKNSREKIILPKRALFQSPEKAETKFKTPETNRSRPRISQGEVGLSPKKLTPTLSSDKRRCSRSLFTPKDNEVLSKVHRQKLLWAVSVALREKGTTSKNVNFREKAGQLYKSTLDIWLKQKDDGEGGLKKKNSGESTSDAMLSIARLLAQEENTHSELEQKSTMSSCETPPLPLLKNERNDHLSIPPAELKSPTTPPMPLITTPVKSQSTSIVIRRSSSAKKRTLRGTTPRKKENQNQNTPVLSAFNRSPPIPILINETKTSSGIFVAMSPPSPNQCDTELKTPPMPTIATPLKGSENRTPPFSIKSSRKINFSTKKRKKEQTPRKSEVEEVSILPSCDSLCLNEKQGDEVFGSPPVLERWDASEYEHLSTPPMPLITTTPIKQQKENQEPQIRILSTKKRKRKPEFSVTLESPFRKKPRTRIEHDEG